MVRRFAWLPTILGMQAPPTERFDFSTGASLKKLQVRQWERTRGVCLPDGSDATVFRLEGFGRCAANRAYFCQQDGIVLGSPGLQANRREEWSLLVCSLVVTNLGGSWFRARRAIRIRVRFADARASHDCTTLDAEEYADLFSCFDALLIEV